MSSTIKPIKIYAHPAAPHPWKVILILRELGLPHELLFKTSPEVTKEEIRERNPNERIPIAEDPNTGLTIWESCAVAMYLVETYDKEAKLSYNTEREKWQVRQWAIMSSTTQDQFFGQKAYFTMFHEPKNIPSVTTHYSNEIKRVLGVIDLHLRRTGQSYLVGDKCTFADLMFVPFNNVLSSVLLYEGFDDEWKSQMPHCYEWHQRLMQRERIKEAFRDKAKAEADMYAANGGVPQR